MHVIIIIGQAQKAFFKKPVLFVLWLLTLKKLKDPLSKLILHIQTIYSKSKVIIFYYSRTNYSKVI